MKKLFCNSDVTVPETDNTPIPCDEFINSDCVILDNISATVKNYFNLGDTPTLTEYAENIGLSLKDVRERIVTLEVVSLNGVNYWNGYRWYKLETNTFNYPIIGEELQGRGDGRFQSGEWIQGEVTVDNPQDDSDINLFVSYP